MKVESKGDALLVSATANTPELATEIANTWANEAALVVNQAYQGEQPLADIQAQREAAQKQYQDAQGNLKSFIQNSQIDALSKKIEESQAVFNKIADDRAWQISYYDDRIKNMEALIVQAEALKRQLQRGNRSGAGDFGDALAVLDARASSLGINQSKMTMDLQFNRFERPERFFTQLCCRLRFGDRTGKGRKGEKRVYLQIPRARCSPG